MGRLGVWAAIAAGVLAGGLLLDTAGLPSSYLFAALLIGLAIALARPGELAVPPNVFRAAQAVAGVSLGAYLQSDALRALASSWLPVALVSLATLGAQPAVRLRAHAHHAARPAHRGARHDRRRRVGDRRHVGGARRRRPARRLHAVPARARRRAAHAARDRALLPRPAPRRWRSPAGGGRHVRRPGRLGADRRARRRGRGGRRARADHRRRAAGPDAADRRARPHRRARRVRRAAAAQPGRVLADRPARRAELHDEHGPAARAR